MTSLVSSMVLGEVVSGLLYIREEGWGGDKVVGLLGKVCGDSGSTPDLIVSHTHRNIV
jgi:hypothetical protein